MKRFLRYLIYATYPFLVLSALLLLGVFGGGAIFVANFTIENRTDVPISVTPIGTYGLEGHKCPLPVTISSFVNLPALKSSAFELAPGKAVTISYDWDDINFSEIVVQDPQGRQYQIITDPNPTANQYHGPLQDHYVIDDLTSLSEVAPEVHEAAERATRHLSAVVVLYALLFGPWLVNGLLHLALRRCKQHQGKQASQDSDNSK